MITHVWTRVYYKKNTNEPSVEFSKISGEEMQYPPSSTKWADVVAALLLTSLCNFGQVAKFLLPVFVLCKRS